MTAPMPPRRLVPQIYPARREMGPVQIALDLLMYRRLFIIAAVAASTTLAPISHAAPAVPKQLREQVERLVALLSDGYAVGYADATMYQVLERNSREEISLVVFTMEGWGGGNMFTQYLAAFSKGTDAQDRDYFTFLDSMPIGGKSWRQIERLDARTQSPKMKGETRFSLNVMVNAEGEPPRVSRRPVGVSQTGMVC